MNENKQPLVLIIDDQFSRVELGNLFRKYVGEEVFNVYKSDRDNLCKLYGLSCCEYKKDDIQIANATFCPAQRWDDSSKRIENDVEVAVEAVRIGWPFSDGCSWDLILLDIRFSAGDINQFGDPRESSFFGADVILPALRREFGPKLPIAVLSSTKQQVIQKQLAEYGVLGFIRRIPGIGAHPNKARQDLLNILAKAQ